MVYCGLSELKSPIPIGESGLYTVNVDIFACIHFRRFMKMVNFACIKIRVSSITGSLGYYRSNFRCVNISADI